MRAVPSAVAVDFGGRPTPRRAKICGSNAREWFQARGLAAVDRLLGGER
jgi:hypothetical protein